MAVQLNSFYDELYHSFFNTVTNNGNSRLAKARDQAFAKNQFLNQLAAILRGYNRAFSTSGSNNHYFIQQYRAGESIETIVAKIVSDYPEVLQIKTIAEHDDTVEQIPFTDNETGILKKFPDNIQQLIGFYLAYSVFSKVYEQVQNNTFGNEQTALALHNIKWTGEKDNRNEFVQLIYSLHQAKLINKGEGEITKIVEELAALFQVNLGNSWQSNLSSSIHKTKTGYNPQIFSKIRSAYEEYAKGLVEEKKKNR